MCAVCEKIEQASQVTIRNNQLFQIEEKDGKTIPAYEYLHPLDELCGRQKREIQGIQQTSPEVLEKFVVTYSYQAVKISQFTSTVEECLNGAFDRRIECDYEEQHLRTPELEEVKKKHEEWLSFLQAL